MDSYQSSQTSHRQFGKLKKPLIILAILETVLGIVMSFFSINLICLVNSHSGFYSSSVVRPEGDSLYTIHMLLPGIFAGLCALIGGAFGIDGFRKKSNRFINIHFALNIISIFLDVGQIIASYILYSDVYLHTTFDEIVNPEMAAWAHNVKLAAYGTIVSILLASLHLLCAFISSVIAWYIWSKIKSRAANDPLVTPTCSDSPNQSYWPNYTKQFWNIFKTPWN